MVKIKIIMAMILFALSARSQAVSIEESYQSNINRVVRVDSLTTRCFAFQIDEQKVLAPYDCVFHLRAINVSLIDNRDKYTRAEVIRYNAKYNLALLELKNPLQKVEPYSFNQSQTNKVSDDRWVIGNRWSGIGHFQRPAIIRTNIAAKEDGKFYLADRFTNGSLVLSESGNVAGLVVDRAGIYSVDIYDQQIQDFLVEKSQDTNSEPKWSDSIGSFHLWFLLSNQSFARKISDTPAMNYFGIGLDFWDRMRIGASTNNSNTNYSSFELGYRFVTPLMNKYVSITPSLVTVDYTKKQDGLDTLSKAGFGAGLNITLIPVVLRLEAFRVSGNWEGTMGFGLGF